MVGTIKRWLGIDVLEAENLRLARAIHSQATRLKECETASSSSFANTVHLGVIEGKRDEDHEVRIAFLENSLTAKTSEAKIVPKATKPNWKTFRTAAEKATEQENPE